MKKSLFHLPLLVCITAAAMLLSACGPSEHVRLRYTSQAPIIAPGPDAAKVIVVRFADARETTAAGLRKDGTSFTPLSGMAHWVADALYQELARRPVFASYVTDPASAQGKGYVVTGTLRKVWIEEKSAIDYQTTVEMTVTMTSGDGEQVFSETLRGSLTRRVVPTEDATQELMTEALRDIVSPLADKIVAATRR
ncbi:hypothetical protein Dde_2754 [Oleidesulfovibrio alaskensis G20]|uniref:ABC-type transport auxiliary lipoprotein component domain-containing protein n=1 Tax=Oleidesulfovibrio alaskensis (strain ATCC BAA-1058 / DSM 17464 / G20) TaxID=207559 RepID=Q30XP6_OLEA2|nr:hypothetical protein [Oleidesulfovibrio alaskensis]ABB39550.1 hypothetical protein Dde_2754 [Oleidesulfovibrio alaskensis G20]MBG0772388.1 hypothetical protein [Oleidesulfovibrio alaskensis]MBL3582250.1 hypothetical protein [Oleidesulfovibrio alaskensis]